AGCEARAAKAGAAGGSDPAATGGGRQESDGRPRDPGDLSRIASPFEIEGIGSGGGDVAADRGGGRRAPFFEGTPGPGPDGGKDQSGECSDHSIPPANHGRGTRRVDDSAGRLARPVGDPPRRRSEARRRGRKREAAG